VGFPRAPRRARGETLEPTRRVERHGTDEPSCERDGRGGRREPGGFRQRPPERGDEPVPVRSGRGLARGLEPDLPRLPEAEERVPADPLPSLDALEEESRRQRRELEERRYRRVEIG